MMGSLDEDRPPFIDERIRPVGRPMNGGRPAGRSPPPSMDGGRANAANNHFNWIQDDMQRHQGAAEELPRQYAHTDPGARPRGWDRNAWQARAEDTAPQRRGWDVPPRQQDFGSAPPSYSSAGSFMSAEPFEERRDARDAAAQEPYREDYRRDPRGPDPGRDARDAAGAGAGEREPKRARGPGAPSRHEAAAKSDQPHGGINRFLARD